MMNTISEQLNESSVQLIGKRMAFEVEYQIHDKKVVRCLGPKS